MAQLGLSHQKGDHSISLILQFIMDFSQPLIILDFQLLRLISKDNNEVVRRNYQLVNK